VHSSGAAALTANQGDHRGTSLRAAGLFDCTCAHLGSLVGSWLTFASALFLKHHGGGDGSAGNWVTFTRGFFLKRHNGGNWPERLPGDGFASNWLPQRCGLTSFRLRSNYTLRQQGQPPGDSLANNQLSTRSVGYKWLRGFTGRAPASSGSKYERCLEIGLEPACFQV